MPYGKWRPVALRWSSIKSYISLYLLPSRTGVCPPSVDTAVSNSIGADSTEAARRFPAICGYIRFNSIILLHYYFTPLIHVIACNASFLHKNSENCSYQKLFATKNSPKCFCGQVSAPNWDSQSAVGETLLSLFFLRPSSMPSTTHFPESLAPP